MAKKNDKPGEYAASGTMDITEHVKTWLAFWAVAKWSAAGLLLIAALLAIFRTHNG
jgi:aa3 type cytochrome c oxidase subunit IV